MATKKLKDWFDGELAVMLAQKISAIAPEFPTQQFVIEIRAGVKPLELKDRVALIADRLKAYLPEDYPEALAILNAILGPENPHETGMFTQGYWLMPMAHFVEFYGLDHFDLSLQAIGEITKRNTGEYCIRPYIERDLNRTLEVMIGWSKADNVHLRRLASEGLRPRLPWAKKMTCFIADPRPILVVLENLKDDPSRFVQKSVANNLNDILKDNFAFGWDVILSWLPQATPQRKWIIKHALRTLVKKDHADAKAIVAGLA